jgi:anthranilate phosphoribosyltransferase
MKYAVGPRKEIGIRTIFNILGPLTNPAGAQRQLLGVFADRLTETIAQVLGNLGSEDVMVVHGEDGLDEITISNGTKVSRCRRGEVETFYITPEGFGVNRAGVETLQGGDKVENAKILLAILKGERGPKRDVVLMNSSAALVVAGKAGDFQDAMLIASDAVDSGNALRKLQEIINVSNSV